ncbi:MAG TPA: hypothetical protein VFW44_21940, partial [Bryobacteraceae bacterium]|nr:hypothetical protein [Bryobacteraceae bacterium]
MTPAARWPPRAQIAAGLALGAYSTGIALAPDWRTKALLCAPLIAIPIFWKLLQTPTAWLALFFGCALLTPPLPIPLGDSGPHIALAVAAAGVFIGFLRLGEWRLRPDALALSLTLLWLVFAASIAMAVLYSGVAIASAS